MVPVRNEIFSTKSSETIFNTYCQAMFGIRISDFLFGSAYLVKLYQVSKYQVQVPKSIKEYVA